MTETWRFSLLLGHNLLPSQYDSSVETAQPVRQFGGEDADGSTSCHIIPVMTVTKDPVARDRCSHCISSYTDPRTNILVLLKKEMGS